MFMWSVTLMIVGGLSFVLPLLGRQFVLVSALGLTGAGSTAIGLVLFVIGLLLFIAANKAPVASVQPQRPLSDPRSRSATGVAPAPVSRAVIPSTSGAAAATPTVKGRFALGGSDYADPYDFGLGLVRNSLDSSERIVIGMIGAGEMPSQQAIKAHESSVQLHSLALISAVYYICANKASGADKHALTMLATGLVDGFAAIFDSGASSESARQNALAIYGLMQDYATSLDSELDSLDPTAVGNNPFDMGPTAQFLIQNIAGQCGIQDALAESYLERMMLEKIARDCGILALLKVLTDQRLTYS